MPASTAILLSVTVISSVTLDTDLLDALHGHQPCWEVTYGEEPHPCSTPTPEPPEAPVTSPLDS